MAALVNLFKMFDKLDDIVYEPVKMVCDLCRQPIRNAEAANERKKMETEARLQQQMKEYELELNLKRHQKELDIEANNRRINAEIDDMIARNELERQSMVVEAIKKYQITSVLNEPVFPIIECTFNMVRSDDSTIHFANIYIPTH